MNKDHFYISPVNSPVTNHINNFKMEGNSVAILVKNGETKNLSA
jgi:hypothetical protein